MKKLCIFLACILYVNLSWASSDAEKNCNYIENWAEFTWLKVVYHNPDSTSGASFEFFRNNREELISAYSDQSPDKFRMLSIPMVARTYHGAKITGNKSSAECIPLVGDTSAIMGSYAIKALYFLGRAAKDGAATIKDKKTIEIKEEGPPTKIQINPGDQMTMGTPWELSGTLAINTAGDVEFNFNYAFNSKDGQKIIAPITGVWSSREIEIPIQDQEKLEDWLVCVTGEYKGGFEKSNFVPIVEDLSKLKTFKDLRDIQQEKF